MRDRECNKKFQEKIKGRLTKLREFFSMNFPSLIVVVLYGSSFSCKGIMREMTVTNRARLFSTRF